MSSQESVGESRVSHPTPGPRANSEAYHFGQSTEEEMEANFKRVDAMEEDQEVTPHFQTRFMLEELQSSAIPNSVIPPNARFLSNENMKKSVTFSPTAMKHPWVIGDLAVTGKLRKEIMDLKQQNNKLEEENRILRGISPRISHHHLRRKRHKYMGMGTPLGNCQAWGRCPGIVSPSHLYLYHFS